MPRTAKNKEVEEKKIYCLCCGSSDQDNFYVSHNPFNKFFEKIPYCKDCIKGTMWKYYIKKYSKNEQLALHGLLRSLNIPYIHSVYLASQKNLANPNATISNADDPKNKNSELLVAAYIKNYNSLFNRNNYGSSYEDSEGLEEIGGVSAYEETIKVKRKRKPDSLENIDTEKYEIIEYDADDLVDYWGEFEDDKLRKLELERLDWVDKLGEEVINDKSTDTMVKQVCYMSVGIQEKIERGEKVKDEVSALQSLLNLSGLVEKTKKKTKDSSIGQRIEEIEKTRPIKECIPELADIDHYRDIIDTYIGGMSNTMGKQNIFSERFNDIYSKYSMDLEGIARSSLRSKKENE